MISVVDYNKLSVDEIYNCISDEINRVYDKFSFLQMPKELFDKIVKKFIENFEIVNKEIKDNVEPFLVADISKKIRTYIGIEVNEHDKKEYIYNYSNNIKIGSEKENVIEFKKFCKYIDECHIELSTDIIDELFKNKALYKILEEILEKNKYALQNDTYEFQTQAENLILSCFIDYNYTDFYEEQEKSTESYEDSVGIYLKECSHRILSREEERDLAVKCKVGTEIERKRARKKFAEYNLRLVVNEAKKHQNRGLDLGDLIGYGNIGLMTAIDKFDVEKGFKFSTFAPWWIRQSIKRAIGDTSRTIRVPIHTLEKINKCNRVIINLRKENGSEPSAEDVALELGWSVKETMDIMNAAIDTVSINSVVGDDEDSELGDFIPDEKAVNPEDSYEVKAEKERFGKILEYAYIAGLYHDCSALPKTLHMQSRDITILILRNGVILPEKYRYILSEEIYNNGKVEYVPGKEYTLEDVGLMFNITRERIRQVESKSKRKLGRLVTLDNQQNLFKVKTKKMIANKGIYDILNQYTKESIDTAVLSLPLSDQETLIRRNNSTSPWTLEDEKMFFETIIPKIEGIIKNANNDVDMFSSVRIESNLLTEELISDIIFSDFNMCDIKVRSAVNILFESKIFNNLLNNLPDFEKEIMLLRFTKVNNHYRTIRHIADCLNIDDSEVSLRINLFMNEYRKSLDNILGMINKK